MLLRLQFLFRKLRIHAQTAHKHIALFLLLVRLCVDRTESIEQELGRGYRKAVFSRSDLHRSRLVSRRSHPAGGKTLPDQLVQAELISRERIFQRRRCSCNIRRPDRLMRILDLPASVRSGLPGRCVFFAIRTGNIISCRCIGFICDPG